MAIIWMLQMSKAVEFRKLSGTEQIILPLKNYFVKNDQIFGYKSAVFSQKTVFW
jgi:hypothetical protein